MSDSDCAPEVESLVDLLRVEMLKASDNHVLTVVDEVPLRTASMSEADVSFRVIPRATPGARWSPCGSIFKLLMVWDALLSGCAPAPSTEFDPVPFR